MIAAERETSMAYTDADAVVRIYTCRRKDMTALRRNPLATVVAEGKYQDGTAWAQFTVPADRFSIAQAIRKRRTMTAAQRSALEKNLQGGGAK